jgi:hypothetical protein
MFQKKSSFKDVQRELRLVAEQMTTWRLSSKDSRLSMSNQSLLWIFT